MRGVKFHHYGTKGHGLDKMLNDLFSTTNFDTFFNPNNYRDDFRNCSTPAVNVLETEEGFNIEVSAPGFAKEDFKIGVENDLLTISAKVEKSEKDAKTKYTRKEFTKRSFKRTFTLPETVNAEAINAKYDSGILTLALPKKEEAKPQPKRVIEIA